MKYLLSVLILIGAWGAGETSARACSCAPPQSPSIERERSAAVFSGRVAAVKEQVATSNSPGMVEVVFETGKVWKGDNSRTISVFTPSNSAACGYSFTVGVDYLIYAYTSEGLLRTGLCSRTKRLNEARDDLGELGSGHDVSATSQGGGEQLAGDISIRVGRKAVLRDKGLTLRFVSVGSDSRCPEGAVCVWEGDADVMVELKAGRKMRVFHLHTSQRSAQETAFGGYVVRLISLDPRPRAGKRLRSADYVAVLRVTKKPPKPDVS